MFDRRGPVQILPQSIVVRMRMSTQISRRGFAEGAVRAAEWMATRSGCFDFHEVYTQL